jgi:hypothetical protein
LACSLRWRRRRYGSHAAFRAISLVCAGPAKETRRKRQYSGHSAANLLTSTLQESARSVLLRPFFSEPLDCGRSVRIL